MDEWFNIVIRQSILYSLPLLISLSLAAMLEVKMTASKAVPQFHGTSWNGCCIPFIPALCFHRGVISALPNPVASRINLDLALLFAHCPPTPQ